MNDSAISVREVAKSFGGVQALSDVSFEVAWNETVGLIGPNGAGKSTLFNAITNVDRPDRGSVRVAGVETRGMLPHKIARLGVARTFQTSRVFPHLSVQENVLVGGYLRPNRAGALSELVGTPRTRRLNRELRERSLQLMEAFGLTGFADVKPSSLPLAVLKKVDLARALLANPRILLLDEPAAGLNDRETDDMTAVIRAVSGLGVTVLVVEHNMSLVMSIARKVVVLDAGRVIAVGEPEETRQDPAVISAYFGRELAN